MKVYMERPSNHGFDTATCYLPEFELPLPADLKELTPLADAVEAMYRQIAANIDESSLLANLRDSLLPQLMSGELDVSNIDL